MKKATTLSGSDRAAAPDAVETGSVDRDAPLSVSVLLRRRAELPLDLVEGGATISPAELAAAHGADPGDVAQVTGLLQGAGLTVSDTGVGPRTLTVSGSVGQLCDFFGIALAEVESTGPDGGRVRHRQRTGGVTVPAELDGIVVAVLGLDNRPQVRPLLRIARASAVHTSYTPLQLGEHYAFPAGTDGTGRPVAVIELGGGFAQDDLDAYFQGLGITRPAVTTVTVDGATNAAGQAPQGADGEVLLDLEVIGALAPASALSAVFAPNTDRGFVDAIGAATHASPTPAAISISWGGPESSWTAQGRASMDAALADAAAVGITVTVAAGDNGSSDGVSSGRHVDFPASSPHALACGGTRLASTAAETVWGGVAGDGATGGGVSADYPLPTWQGDAGVPAASGHKGGRGVPDVAGDADPQTGYAVRIDGQSEVIGGTSAVAPLWAALAARLAQAIGRPLGLLAPLLYAGVQPGITPAGFRDITQGSNGAFRAAAGWDACTGLGVPDGEELLTKLRAALTV